MQKNELLRQDDNIIRILAEEGDEVLYIPCQGIKGTMPRWCRTSEFKEYVSSTEDELLKLNGMEIVSEDELTPAERNTARQRYTIIAPVLGCLEDEKIRTQMIEKAAVEHGIT